MFRYIDFEECIPARHPLSKIRAIVNDALRALYAEVGRLHVSGERPSIAPERLIRGKLLFLRFVGLGIGDMV
ncbi:hypothetical protein B5V46_03490 [Rhodovulum sp. MB263]|nr:hypothetical protein B5V46_03490 [Rhodovulum sp. MB263]